VLRFAGQQAQGRGPANYFAHAGGILSRRIQIDEEAQGDTRFGEPDGAFFSHTGAIYKIQQLGSAPGQQQYQNNQQLAAGQWHRYEIEVNGQTYTVRLNGQQTTRFTRRNDGTLRGNPPSVDPQSGSLECRPTPAAWRSPIFALRRSDRSL
jgi:hypothetical protein